MLSGKGKKVIKKTIGEIRKNIMCKKKIPPKLKKI